MNIHCEYTKLVDPKSLKQHPKNRNKHSPEQIDRLCKILEYQGWRYPIKVSKESGHITSGHGRLMAAVKMKLKEVPVSVQSYTSEEQEYADIQSDNAIASWSELDLSGINMDIGDLGPDFDIDLLGIKNFTLDVSEKGQCDEDEVPDKVEAKTKLGDMYRLGTHTLMCGDSTDILCVEKLMDGEKADLVLTDPPYGINLKYSSYEDTEENWFELIDLIMPIAKTFGNFIIMPCCRIKSLDWWYKNHKPDWIMCWYKGSPGHRSQIGFNDWEPHLTWGKPVRQMHDYFQTKCGFEIEGHPCPKPVEYAETLMDMSLDKGGLILDLFGGSGTTLISAQKTNRKCFMMELDPHYCDVIVTRWEKYTGKTAELINA